MTPINFLNGQRQARPRARGQRRRCTQAHLAAHVISGQFHALTLPRTRALVGLSSSVTCIYFLARASPPPVDGRSTLVGHGVVVAYSSISHRSNTMPCHQAIGELERENVRHMINFSQVYGSITSNSCFLNCVPRVFSFRVVTIENWINVICQFWSVIHVVRVIINYRRRYKDIKKKMSSELNSRLAQFNQYCFVSY